MIYIEKSYRLNNVDRNGNNTADVLIIGYGRNIVKMSAHNHQTFDQQRTLVQSGCILINKSQRIFKIVLFIHTTEFLLL